MAKVFYNILPFLHMYNWGMGTYQSVRRPSSPTYRGSTVFENYPNHSDKYIQMVRIIFKYHLSDIFAHIPYVKYSINWVVLFCENIHKSKYIFHKVRLYKTLFHWLITERLYLPRRRIKVYLQSLVVCLSCYAIIMHWM